MTSGLFWRDCGDDGPIASIWFEHISKRIVSLALDFAIQTESDARHFEFSAPETQQRVIGVRAGAPNHAIVWMEPAARLWETTWVWWFERRDIAKQTHQDTFVSGGNRQRRCVKGKVTKGDRGLRGEF